MKSLFKQMLEEFHREPLAQPFKRHIDWPDLPDHVKKAMVLIGVRRCGKTWVAFQSIQQRLAAGIEKTRIIYLNFEDDRLAQMSVDQFQAILDAYYELYPKHHEHKIYCYFDEIQEVDHWEKFIRRLLDQTQFDITITGSSAKMLSKEVATGLRGRTLTREIYPFSFAEYLQFKGVDVQPSAGVKQRAMQQIHCEDYLQWGGFPETLGVKHSLHRELIQSYVETVIYRDVIERHKINNVQAVKHFISHCLRNPATPLSINKIYKTMQSLGVSVSKDSLYEYLDYFTDAYCIFPVPIFSLSVRYRNQQPKKIYPVDPGMITTYTVKPDFDLSALLETVVYLHLRRRNQDVFYYNTKNKKEIDFVVLDENETVTLYQVCVSLADERTYQREVSAIEEAAKELQPERAIIITLDNTQGYQFETDVNLQHISLIDFLL